VGAKLLPRVRFCNRAGYLIDKPYPYVQRRKSASTGLLALFPGRESHFLILYDVDGSRNAA
jgi:hypothetical protein